MLFRSHWPVSSVGQSVVLITPRSRVPSPYGPLRAFDFLFMLVIMSFSLFKIIVVSIWTDIKLPEKPSESKLVVIFLNESISL